MSHAPFYRHTLAAIVLKGDLRNTLRETNDGRKKNRINTIPYNIKTLCIKTLSGIECFYGMHLTEDTILILQREGKTLIDDTDVN